MEHLSIYFVTWNVATRSPEQELHQLLGICHHGSNASKPLPDLYFIGLQEVKSQPQNIVLDMIFEDPWTKAFREVLKEHDYIKIRTQRLQGLVLNFFCRTKHFDRLRSIEAQYTKTGFGGMWGNKGAVSVRLNIYGVNICVVNTHLTPHDHLLADRICDYNTILRQHAFNADDTSNIFFHDYVFWIGDLNFRLNAEDLDAGSISSLVTKNQLNELLKRDQLKQVRESGEAFSELIENDITFPPTYKYEFTSQEFDLKRKPSWTDRILYKVNSLVYERVELKAVQKNYNSHASYVQSDHKPVTGEFDIVVRPEFDFHGVEFEPISQWFINEQNSVYYQLIGDTEAAEGDWVGLYQNNFSSLDEYLVYEYIFRGKTTLDATAAVAEPSTSSSREVILFSDTALRSPGMYRLVYVTQKGDLVGVLGVSAPFPGHHRNI